MVALVIPVRRRKVFAEAGCSFLLVCFLGCATHPSPGLGPKTVKSADKQAVTVPSSGVEAETARSMDKQKMATLPAGTELESEGTPPPAIPYRVLGVTYRPLESARGFSQEGIASWYGPKFHGQLTSNKEIYDMNAMTAAHKTLPFNTRVKVVNLENGLEAVVRINDRGPFVGDRIIDLSRKAAERLGVIEKGTARVRVTALTPTSGSHSETVAPAAENFSVQVGVFKDRGNAGRLERQVPNSRIEAQARGKETYFRVLVGHYANFEEAVKQMDALRSLGHTGVFVVAASKKP